MARRLMLPLEVRASILLGWMAGRLQQDVAAEFGVSAMTVRRIRQDPLVREHVYASRGSRLDLADREEISRGLARGWSFRRIARGIDRSPSTIKREVDAGGGREAYRAAAAHAEALERARRPKPSKFEQHPELAVQVECWLETQQWSPAQISARLPLEYPDDETMRVAPETIYQALYVYGRGGLRKELTKHLRSERKQRRPRTVTARNRQGSPIPDMVNIADRPEDINDRLVPGHWEGDLILGKDGGSQVATLVERTTGFVLLAKLANKQAPTVARALANRIQTLPDQPFRSITWDQGTEMANHTSFTIATGIPVYFCDPHAPWQRGSNENTNGLLRQYLPKSTDLSAHSQDALDAIAHKLNGRPRKRHQFLTPYEVFDQLVLQ